jgi:hypothetical protein
MIPICDLYRGRKPPIINHFYQYATSAEVVQYRLDSYEKNTEWILLAQKWLMVIPIVLLMAYFWFKWKREAQRDQKRREEERQRSGDKYFDSWDEGIEYFVDTTPATPIAFGGKVNWLAIRSDQHEQLVGEFSRKDKKAFRTNMQGGIHGAWAGFVFVSPPISGWTMVIGINLNLESEKDLEYMKELSKKYGEVQFFGSFRGVNYSAWAKFVQGETIRAYGAADGNVIINIGVLTPLEQTFIEEERQRETDPEFLELLNTSEGQLLCLSDEENVLRMAESWSINPDKLDQIEVTGLGTIME